MVVSNNKRALLVGTALLGGWLFAGSAFAQSTGSEATERPTEVEALVVRAGVQTLDGEIIKETVTKTRSTITQEFIDHQSAGQSALQDINLLPGVNFTNNDPYGSSGGNLRIRSFDGPRISLTFDGVPLNDSGNYAIFSNQMLDGELISRVQVNLGTTDVDSPTASATGGTVAIATRRPADEWGGEAKITAGSFNFIRAFGMIDTGEFWDSGVAAWMAASYQRYDKFKGPGSLQKKQVNGRVYKDLGHGDFLSLAGHVNINRNNFYRNPTMAQWNALHFGFENFNACTRDTPTAGTADNEGASPLTGGSENPLNPSACTNYYNLKVNPSNTGNLRGQLKYHLADNLILTVDPSWQYVLANGGGTTTLAESGNSTLTRQLIGNAYETGARAFDLNGDGDTLDTIRYYTPNNTNTRRLGMTASAIWDMDNTNRLRIAYTYDYAHHRQTGEWTKLDAAGNPLNVFGARGGSFAAGEGEPGLRVTGPDGSFMRQRDRLSIAMLNQIAADYNGWFMDDKLRINVGLRAPYFERDLHNYCYTNSAGFGYCSTARVGRTNANGTVDLVGMQLGDPGFATDASVPHFLPPFDAVKKYDKLLPNLGASYDIAEGQSIYASYAQGLSAPRTDNLYNFSIPNVQPETTDSFDLGWRYQQDRVLSSVALWKTIYKNRIVSSFDQDLGINVDRNVGQVDIWGVDSEIGFKPTTHFSVYGSASYNHSEVRSDIQQNATTLLLTNGKKLVETPDWTVSTRAQYATDFITVGAQAKWVSKRFSTDINDQETPGYVTADLDLRVRINDDKTHPAFLQLNVTNLFDKRYLAGISSKTNAITIPDPDAGGPKTSIAGSAPTYTVGAPRTLQLTLQSTF